MLSQQQQSASPSPYSASSPVLVTQSPPPPPTAQSVSSNSNGVAGGDASSPQPTQNHLNQYTTFATSTQLHQPQAPLQHLSSSSSTSTVSTHPQQQHLTSYQHQPVPNHSPAAPSVSSSYLDVLSESPSVSVLSPHMGDIFNNSEAAGNGYNNIPSNGTHFSRVGASKIQQANGLGTDDSLQQQALYHANPNLSAASGFSAALGRLPLRPSQQQPNVNGLSNYDDVSGSYLHHDLYSSSLHHPQMSIPQSSQETRQSYDIDAGGRQGPLGNPRSGSLYAPTGPYGTGSTLPESQQVTVNKAIQHQAQQLVQQQVQQQQQQLHHQQQQIVSQQQQQLATIINNLPPGISSRDYLLALQQMQTAQAQTLTNISSVGSTGLHHPNPLVSTPAGGSNALIAAPSLPNNAQTTSLHEEISTIFVVGFPDDMQEREFQNMFTFCPGFEAATLKVPHKELPALGASGNTNPAQAAAATLRSAGFIPPGPQGSFNGAPDFSFLNSNSGVLGDAQPGLWNGLAANGATVDDHYRAAAALSLGPSVGPTGGPEMALLATAAPPPRKQIIGFAKFRTRQEALDAREVLQGRRVDMEKGSILKAEMAKKNLHTKRGVGPSGGPSSNTASNSSNAASGNAAGNQQHGTTTAPVLSTETLAAGLAAAGYTVQAQQLRELNGLAGLGLPAPTQQQSHPSIHHHQQTAASQPVATASLDGELFNPREHELNTVGFNGASGVAVGSNRERGRDRDSGDRDPRSRQNTLNAYEAFHSVPASLPPRPTTFSTLPPLGASRSIGALPSSTLNGVTGLALPGSSFSDLGIIGGTTTPRNGSNGSAFSAGLSMDQGMSSGTGSLSLSPLSGLDGGISSSVTSGGSSSLWTTSGFRDPVDPVDTSGAMPAGPASVVGGPTSSASSSAGGPSLQPGAPSSVHTLSRQPSTTFQHSSPEQDHAPFPLPNGPSSGQAGSQLLDAPNQQRTSQSSAQHSPAIPQIASPPISQGSQTQSTQTQGMFGYAGLSVGPLEVPSGSSSRGSADSSSPPEKFQQRSIFDNFMNSDPLASGAGSFSNSAISNPNNINGGYDSDLARTMAGLTVGNGMSSGTHPDMTSPQLPSPGSGGSGSGGGAGTGSTTRPNAADQNPPINTLYVGNLPSGNAAHPSTLEDGLRGLFSRCPGYRKLCFRQKSNGPMCFVEFDDVPCATKALNDLYGNNVSGLVKGGIRLSFSKNPLGVRAGSMSSNGGSVSHSTSLFNAALAGISEPRFPSQGHLMQQRHASLSGLPSYASDMPLPRTSRQDSIDALAPGINSYGFVGASSHLQSHPFTRSFSPSSYQQQQQQQQVMSLPQNPILPQRSVSVSMNSLSQQQLPQQSSSLYSQQPQQHPSSSVMDSGLNHHSLNILGHTSTFIDPRESHYQPFSNSSNTNSSAGGPGPSFPSSPQPMGDP